MENIQNNIEKREGKVYEEVSKDLGRYLELRMRSRGGGGEKLTDEENSEMTSLKSNLEVTKIHLTQNL